MRISRALIAALLALFIAGPASAVPNWIYDGTAGPYGNLTGNQFPKTDLFPLPAGSNPSQYVVAFDWNSAIQALNDIRNDWLGAKFFGFVEQAADPAPSGLGGVGQAGYLWAKTDHALH